MGDKYIIELEEKPFHKDNGDFLYRVKGFNSLVFDMNGIQKLAPYTEPDMGQVRKEAYEDGFKNAVHNCPEGCPYVEQARNEAYQRGVEDGAKSVENWNEQEKKLRMDEAYQKGLSDAWEAARKIGSNSMCSLKEMGFDFGQCVINDYNPSWFVVKNYSASECIEKLRQYEQKQEKKDSVWIANRSK